MLSVEDRVRIEVAEMRRSNPKAPVSVSAICKACKISRASLYSWHRELVREILAGNPQNVIEIRRSDEAKEVRRTETVDRLTKENKALCLLCVELGLEVRKLKAKLEEITPGAKKGRVRKS